MPGVNLERVQPIQAQHSSVMTLTSDTRQICRVHPLRNYVPSSGVEAEASMQDLLDPPWY